MKNSDKYLDFYSTRISDYKTWLGGDMQWNPNQDNQVIRSTPQIFSALGCVKSVRIRTEYGPEKLWTRTLFTQC